MKKIIVWLITLMFFVAFAFTSIKLNAAELNIEYTTSDESGTFTLTLLEENKYKLVAAPLGETEETIVRGTYEYYDEELNLITLYLSDIVFDTFQLNDETHTFDFYEIETDTPVIDESEQEQPDNFEVVVKDKTKEITDYVIALVVSFLGSSAFYAIVKAITSHGSRILKDKISELEKQNQISQKAKEIYEAKIADLENTLVDATEKIDVVLEQFTKYLELDAAKQKQAAELLEKLLPPVDNNENKKEGE